MKNNVKKIVVNNFKDKIKPIANKPKPKINYIERYKAYLGYQIIDTSKKSSVNSLS